MQKNAWTFTIVSAVLGTLGLLFRWLQCQSIFEAETGLPVKGAGISTMVVLSLGLILLGVWLLAKRLTPPDVPNDPDEPLGHPNKLCSLILGAASVAAALGSVVMFLGAVGWMMRSIALLGLFSAAVLYLTPSLSRWGAFGCLLSVVPILFFGLWLVVYYKDNNSNPIVWEYAVQILAIIACLLGAYRLSGFLFYRTRPVQGVFACGLGLAMGLTELMDSISMGARLTFFGWAVGFGVLGWMLLNNLYFQGPERPESMLQH